VHTNGVVSSATECKHGHCNRHTSAAACGCCPQTAQARHTERGSAVLPQTSTRAVSSRASQDLRVRQAAAGRSAAQRHSQVLKQRHLAPEGGQRARQAVVVQPAAGRREQLTSVPAEGALIQACSVLLAGSQARHVHAAVPAVAIVMPLCSRP
jgi:hypothetical protein